MSIQHVLEKLVRHGSSVVLAATFLLISISDGIFLSTENILNIFHTMAPWRLLPQVSASSSSRVDWIYSVGSTAFLPCAVGALLMKDHGLDPILHRLSSWRVGVFLVRSRRIVSVLRSTPDRDAGTMIAYPALPCR